MLLLIKTNEKFDKMWQQGKQELLVKLSCRSPWDQGCLDYGMNKTSVITDYPCNLGHLQAQHKKYLKISELLWVEIFPNVLNKNKRYWASKILHII